RARGMTAAAGRWLAAVVGQGHPGHGRREERRQHRDGCEQGQSPGSTTVMKAKTHRGPPLLWTVMSPEITAREETCTETAKIARTRDESPPNGGLKRGRSFSCFVVPPSGVLDRGHLRRPARRQRRVPLEWRRDAGAHRE